MAGDQQAVPDPEIQHLLKDGFSALSRGALAKAADNCRKVLDARPDLTQGHFLVGLVALERKDRKTAFQAFNTVTRLDEKHAAAWAQLAKLFMGDGQVSRADVALQKAVDCQASDPIVLDLPLTITGDRRDFEETLIDDLAQHPWAGLPITISLSAEDAAGQIGTGAASETILPARRFFDPLASSIIEQRGTEKPSNAASNPSHLFSMTFQLKPARKMHFVIIESQRSSGMAARSSLGFGGSIPSSTAPKLPLRSAAIASMCRASGCPGWLSRIWLQGLAVSLRRATSSGLTRPQLVPSRQIVSYSSGETISRPVSST